jgi:DNA anti-recombination protein RmuC
MHMELAAEASQGMEPQWFTVIITGAAVLVTLVVQVVLGVWAIARMKDDLRQDAERRERDLRDSAQVRHKEVLDRFDRETRMVGETISAIRQELSNFRIFAAETYQRRDSYHTQMTSFNQAMNSKFESIEEKMESRFGKVDEKLEKLGEKLDFARSS